MQITRNRRPLTTNGEEIHQLNSNFFFFEKRMTRKTKRDENVVYDSQHVIKVNQQFSLL